MKSLLRSLLAILVLFVSSVTYSQIHKPVKWQFEVGEIKGPEATLILTAKIDKNWHLYSQFIAEGGPIKTTFNFVPSNDYNLVGSVTEPTNFEEVFDPSFDMKLRYFSN